jgi:hypothetical protein
VTARWYLSSAVVAAAVGWLAARIHLSGWTPLGLLSLAVGIGLGFSISKLATATGICCRKRLVVGALLFAAIAVFAEHAWLYRDFRRQWNEARASEPQVAMFRREEPWSPTEYLRHEIAAGRVALWCMDAALIATGTLGTVLVGRSASTDRVVVADDAN